MKVLVSGALGRDGCPWMRRGLERPNEGVPPRSEDGTQNRSCQPMGVPALPIKGGVGAAPMGPW